MCLTPMAIKQKIGDTIHWVHVPCGHCLECMKDKQNEFAIRSIEEVKKYGSMVFFTLTYAEPNITKVPVFDDECEIDENTGEVFARSVNTLNRRDIINWKKRVRMAYKRLYGHNLAPFGYVICGEYGPKTHRPHYHGAFYGLPKEAVFMFKKDWETNFGYTCFKKIPTVSNDNRDHVEATSKYIAKYICKVKELEDPLVLNNDVEKPRKITSRGFGISHGFDKMKSNLLAYDSFGKYDLNNLTKENGERLTKKEVKQIVDTICRRRKYHRNGKDYKLPQYYKRKIFYYTDDFGKMKSSSIQHLVAHALELRVREDFNRKLHEVASLMNCNDYFEAVRKVYEIEERNLQNRAQTILETNMKSFRWSKF